MRFGIGLDLLRGLLDAGELSLVIVYRQIEPAGEVIACAGTAHERVIGGLRRRAVGRMRIERGCAFKIDCYHRKHSFKTR